MQIRGANSNLISTKLSKCKYSNQTSHVLLHTGDIDARINPQSAVRNVLTTIEESMKVQEF